MAISDVVLVQWSDDWQALFVNGLKVTEGHHIGVEEFAEHVGIELQHHSWEDDLHIADDEWSVPKTIEEVRAKRRAS